MGGRLLPRTLPQRTSLSLSQRDTRARALKETFPLQHMAGGAT